MATQRITFTVGQLAPALGAVIHAAAKDEERQILHGVHFDFAPAGKRATSLSIVACDNYRMAIFPLGLFPAWCQPFTLRLEDAADLVKALAVKGLSPGAPVTFTPQKDGTISIKVGVVTRDVMPYGGPYPNWRGIAEPVLATHEDKEAFRIVFNPLLLADTAKAAKALGRTMEIELIAAAGPLSPTLVRFPHDTSGYREIIMPIRTGQR